MKDVTCVYRWKITAFSLALVFSSFGIQSLRGAFYRACAQTSCLPSSWIVSALELQSNAKVWSFYLHLSRTCNISIMYRYFTLSAAFLPPSFLLLKPAACLRAAAVRARPRLFLRPCCSTASNCAHRQMTLNRGGGGGWRVRMSCMHICMCT